MSAQLSFVLNTILLLIVLLLHVRLHVKLHIRLHIRLHIVKIVRIHKDIYEIKKYIKILFISNIYKIND